MQGALRFPWLPRGCMLWDLVLRKPADSYDPPGHFISRSFGPFPLVILWSSHLQISNDFRGSLLPLLTERSLQGICSLRNSKDTKASPVILSLEPRMWPRVRQL